MEGNQIPGSSPIALGEIEFEVVDNPMVARPLMFHAVVPQR